MTWTYGNTPGTATATERRDGVRWLVGDTDTTDQQTSDEEIAFALTQSSDDIYLAGSIVCRAIAAKYARLVDVSVDDTELTVDYSKRQEAYLKLAGKLERQSVRGPGGSIAVGIPVAGGISVSDVDSVEQNLDRPTPAFPIQTVGTGDYDGAE